MPFRVLVKKNIFFRNTCPIGLKLDVRACMAKKLVYVNFREVSSSFGEVTVRSPSTVDMVHESLYESPAGP